ncbi:hypothetical protein [Streptomyces sp. NPDC058612]|uniref:hypothetical protein n=1 Tax=Streptomyces sp. NPDC058612 TaxID=3346555 RepID=UPI0036564E88
MQAPDPQPQWTDDLTREEYEQAWYLWRARERDAHLNVEETAVVIEGMLARFDTRASALSPATADAAPASPQVSAPRSLTQGSSQPRAQLLFFSPRARCMAAMTADRPTA